MTNPQILIFVILAAMMGLFLSGRLRHDVVALAALMACVIVGVVPAGDAFAGFGHPAVITVACVLVLSHGLRITGAVDWLARSVLPRDAGRLTTMFSLLALGAILSGFMNNVGAMALLMPIAVQLSGRLDLAPGQVLMPLAFGTILGGMTTLMGTPPNLIVSGFREEAGLGQFAMFDFAPVGVAVAALGVIFVAAIGWRLVPVRKSAAGTGFDTGSYLTEVRVPDNSKAVGLTLRAFEAEIEDSGTQIVGLVRNEVRMTAPSGGRRIRRPGHSGAAGRCRCPGRCAVGFRDQAGGTPLIFKGQGKGETAGRRGRKIRPGRAIGNRHERGNQGRGCGRER
jgi:di/tricarboxylate transporter